MERSADHIVLAIECGHCRQITGIQVYNGALYIVRCGVCGQVFPTAEELVRQYQVYSARIASHEVLCQALHEAREAMTSALEHWGRKAGKEVLSQALSTGGVVDP
jgi:transcription elongation factor Elf1